MRFSWHWLCSRLRPGAILMLWTGALFAPQAQAGCEDGILVIMPRAIDLHHTDASRAANTRMKSPHSSSVPGRRPCSGPHCSRIPLVPPAPLAAPVVSSQDWACIPIAPLGIDSDGFDDYREESCHTPIFHSFRLYRPPR